MSVDLKALKEDGSARQVMKKLGRMVDYLLVQDEAVIFDIGTPRNFEELKNKISMNN